MAKNFSTFMIAEMLHVDPGSVANWIDRKLLKAHRTPGGHRRVATEDLMDFLREHEMPVPPNLKSTPTRVLVVDDEPPVAQVIARAIRESYPNIEVHEAHDGFQAGTLVATVRPDLVLLDLRMPGMDGYQVCQMIRSLPATKQTEILAMTAFPTPESERRILQCGARICLHKPLDMDRLLTEVAASI